MIHEVKVLSIYPIIVYFSLNMNVDAHVLVQYIFLKYINMYMVHTYHCSNAFSKLWNFEDFFGDSFDFRGEDVFDKYH